MMPYQFTACAPNRALCKLLGRYTNVFGGEREREKEGFLLSFVVCHKNKAK